MNPHVIFVDDEPSIRLATGQTLKLAGIGVTAVATMEDGLALVGHGYTGVVVTDVRMPGRSGLDLLDAVMQLDREIPVIVVTGHGDVPMAVDAMRSGAYDFLEKPYRPEHLVVVVRRGLEKRRLVLENRALRRAMTTRDGVPALLGDSAAAQVLRGFIETIGPSGVDVMICGETGTGKEVMARELHAARSADAPFVAINCAAIPEAMFESEMFGHEAGAFTGALKRRIGKFELARRGTVFLDEIESLPPAMQAKLLRVLQERLLERVGGNDSIRVDCRVIGATKVDLLRESTAGRFREDLFYRIAIVSIELPPLRDRAADIPSLFAQFVHQACLRFERPVPDWTAAQMDAWQRLPWRGNVRELKAFADRFVLGVPDAARNAAADLGSTLPLQLEVFERRLLREALHTAQGNVGHAANRLGIPRKTLYDKLKRHGIATDAAG